MVLAEQGESVTGRELAAELMKNPDQEVELSIGNPKDTAYTNEIQKVELSEEGRLVVRGWVSSDNEGAFAPWAEEIRLDPIVD